MRRFAEWILSQCTENKSDYFERYQAKAKKQQEENLSDDSVKESFELCPICSSKLVLRNGKRGPFIGCSGFPKCRYTKPVPDKQI